jgi:hypothetical protein
MANNIPLGFMLAGGSLPGCITQARASLTMTMCLTNDALLGCNCLSIMPKNSTNINS